LLIRKNKR